MRGLICILLLVVSLAPASAANDDVWAKLKEPGHIALMRHANAPGLGDEPPGIDLKNCAIQRNLDDKGKTQARSVGDEFRKHGIKQVRLVSSQFCRALDTAKLMKLGSVGSSPVLNYLTDPDPSHIAAATDKTLAFMKGLPRQQPVVLVTHGPNVKAMTSATPDSAEMVVVHFENGKLAVDGRIPAP